MRIICLFIVALFFIYKVLLYRIRIKHLLDNKISLWGVNDALMIIVYCVYIIFAFLYNF